MATDTQNATWRGLPQTIVVVLVVALLAWIGQKALKYRYSGSSESAKSVPAWMIDGRFGTLSSADVRALRKDQCSHDPVYLRPKSDGTVVLTCGTPVHPGPMLLFVAEAFESNLSGMVK